MRRSVVLPQPEAPSRLTNSPEATSSEMPCRISTAPKDLRMFSRRTLAMGQVLAKRLMPSTRSMTTISRMVMPIMIVETAATDGSGLNSSWP